MRLTQRLWAAGMVCLALVLAGCTGGDPPSTSASSTSASTTPTDSAKPTETVTAPAAPPEAAVKDPEGAQAYVRYWFGLVNYGFATGDTQPLLRASPSECVECSAYAELIHGATDDGQQLRGQPVAVLAADAPALDGDRVFVSVAMQEDAYLLIQADGTETEIPAKEPRRVKALVSWDGDSWQMIGIAE